MLHLPINPDDPGVRALLHYHNVERQTRGLRPLVMNARLLQCARDHAVWMATSGHLTHVGRDGSLLGDRLSAAGYRYRTGGENIAFGYSDGLSVVRAWMNSPGHRVNILEPDYREIGPAHATTPAGETYWCVVFAARASMMAIFRDPEPINVDRLPEGARA